MKKSLLIVGLFLASIEVANAASVSVSANTAYPTSGGKVTFYVNINGAAWQLSGSGSGATSNCYLGEDGVGDSGNGNNINKSIPVTCSCTGVGQINFAVSGNVTDANGKTENVSARKVVAVQAPRQKDSNNNLSSLSVEGYKISPEFNADTLEYTVDVPSTVNNIKINASLASNYASLEGNGEKEVNEGANLFEIKVTSETGIEKIYKLTANVKDENPINIKINNESYTIIKNAKNLTKPETFEETTVKINDITIPAFYNELTKLTLIGVKDTEGKTFLVIYKEGQTDYEIYNETKSNQMVLFIRKIPDEKEGYTKSKIKINEIEYECLKISENSEFAIIYATNLLTGKDEYYIYDSVEGSYIRYNDEQIKPLQEEINKYKSVVTSLIIALGASIFFLMLAIIIRPHNKKKKVKESLQKAKEQVEQKNIIKEENKEEEKIKEETKISLNETLEKEKKKKKEPEKKIDNLDETMYNIFENEKKSKKRKKKGL